MSPRLTDMEGHTITKIETLFNKTVLIITLDNGKAFHLCAPFYHDDDDTDYDGVFELVSIENAPTRTLSSWIKKNNPESHKTPWVSRHWN